MKKTSVIMSVHKDTLDIKRQINSFINYFLLKIIFSSPKKIKDTRNLRGKKDFKNFKLIVQLLTKIRPLFLRSYSDRNRNETCASTFRTGSPLKCCQAITLVLTLEIHF